MTPAAARAASALAIQIFVFCNAPKLLRLNHLDVTLPTVDTRHDHESFREFLPVSAN